MINQPDDQRHRWPEGLQIGYGAGSIRNACTGLDHPDDKALLAMRSATGRLSNRARIMALTITARRACRLT